MITTLMHLISYTRHYIGYKYAIEITRNTQYYMQLNYINTLT